MAERVNKFKSMYKARTEATLTDDIADQLYKEEDNSEKIITNDPQIEKNNNIPVETTLPDPINVPENESYQKSAVVPTESPVEPQSPKRKPGRPKKSDKDTIMFNFRITESTKQMLSIASAANGFSMTDYLENLIEDDYKKNQDFYDTVKARQRR